MARRAIPYGYLVHAYTASGIVLAWFALVATLGGEYRKAFLLLLLATLVDTTDGTLARRADVARTAPLIDGAQLDNIIDFATYVFVPVVLVWRAELLPAGLSEWVIGLVLLASAAGFAHHDAKTDDHLFTGFPSYWNVVALYLYALGWSPAVNAGVLVLLAGLVFVPVRYVYPSRTTAGMSVTVPFGMVWCIQVLLVIWWLPAPPRWLVLTSLAFPAYYLVLSLWLTARRARGSPASG